jgi:hypothetical protein
MSRLKPLLLAASVLTLILAAGCGDPCLSLAQQICSCQLDQTSVDSCNQRAKQAQAIFPESSVDQQYCQKQLDNKACDCTKLNTREGRVACGIAYTWAPESPATPLR